jgi:hypothetical protein
MLFELISWIYISLVCFLWGNIILKFFTGPGRVAFGFSVLCLLGMSVVGIVTYYISLVVPLYTGVKVFLQVPVFLSLLKSSNRQELVSKIKLPFARFASADFVFFFSIVLMLLFLCSSSIIHPDTLNYHAFSVRIFDRYGSIPGIANLKLQYGFQSIWFGLQAFFDVSIFQRGPWFPLNGCVLCWFFIFLVPEITKHRNRLNNPISNHPGIWYLFLIIFSILSWTQVRLTASSLSPDFIATLFVLMSFYFFCNRDHEATNEESDPMAVFFSLAAVTVKFSVIPVLLIPIWIFGRKWRERKLRVSVQIIALGMIMLTPIIIRNIISSGYPFFPSAFAAMYSFEWKVNQSLILPLEHYITVYARHPTAMINADLEYKSPLVIWLPLWWKHLYVVDKLISILIPLGVCIDFIFLRQWMGQLTTRMRVGFVVALTGTLVWFFKAPDPRFGTGFLLPLIYFQYCPFSIYLNRLVGSRGNYLIYGIRNVTAALIIGYVGYRAVYFFHSSQIIFPDGISNTAEIPEDCDAINKKMLMDGKAIPANAPDSCGHNFRFRGKLISQGFKPVQ